MKRLGNPQHLTFKTLQITFAHQKTELSQGLIFANKNAVRNLPAPDIISHCI